MPLQNRVDPWGQLHAVAARGDWLGNRGILHDDKKRVIAQWRHKHWVTCFLEFKGRRRKIFSPNSYSELFFLDEATAFSAGHRPCAECRRERYKEFKASWCAANAERVDSSNPSVAEIDNQLHAERAVPGGGKVVFQAELGDLPNGTFIELHGRALLRWADQLYVWSATEYDPFKDAVPLSTKVNILTPRSLVRMFNRDFKPQVHDSVCS